MKLNSKEELENIRRRAERGRNFVYNKAIFEKNLTAYNSIIDEFQGILDLVENIKVYEQN